MADVTISSLPLGTPAGGNVLPYSTGTDTLGVPVSALFQSVSAIGINGPAVIQNTDPYTAGGPVALVLYNSNITDPSVGLGSMLQFRNYDRSDSSKDTISFTACDTNGSFRHSAAIASGKESLWIGDSGNYPGYLSFWTRQAGANEYERIRITSTGNVGIGTTTPVAKLDVNGDVKATSYKTGSLPMFGANAFVHFHGAQDVNGNASTANTARRIYAGGNVSSVVRNADGLYTIYFTTALTSTEYMAVCSARHRDGVTFITHSEVRDRLTTSCVVNVQSNPGGAEGSVAYDSRDVDVMIIC